MMSPDVFLFCLALIFRAPPSPAARLSYCSCVRCNYVVAVKDVGV